jgi:CRP/FNR family cyclic AMP-dependent transcriptional regulator
MKSLAHDPATITRLLLQQPLFADVPPAVARDMAKYARMRSYDADEVLIDAGDSAEWLWVLHSGVVGHFGARGAGPANVLMRILAAPSCFGDAELVSNTAQLVRVEAFEPCEVVVIPHATFHTVLRGNAEACWGVVTNLARQVTMSTFHEAALALQSIEERLAATLLSFLQAYGDKRSDGSVRLKRRITQDTLARCLGTTRKSVERAMAAWQAAGLLTREDGWYVFSSKDALRARTDPERLLLYSRLDERVRAAGEATFTVRKETT